MSTAKTQQARRYYALVAGASFCLGAGMELFMVRRTIFDAPSCLTSLLPFPLPFVSNQCPPQIKTGFYEKVTMIEAEERQIQRERLLAQQGGAGNVE